jgi:hypothetical protein
LTNSNKIEEEEHSSLNKEVYNANNVYLSASRTDQIKQIPEKLTQLGNRPQKILICSTSNCAIDKIMNLLM